MSRVPPRLRVDVDEWLDERFASQRPPFVKELAQKLNVSTRTLSARFYKQERVHLSTYIKDAQIARAKWLLKTTDLSNTEIARRAAYKNEQTFYRGFKRATGMTPGGYRQRTSRVTEHTH